MDANGQRFWMLADEGDWPWRRNLHWDRKRRVLRLISRRRLPVTPNGSPGTAADANTALERVPRACDRHGGVSWWDSDRGAVLCAGGGLSPIDRLRLTEGPTDLVVGHDGILYVISASGIRLHDLRQRWTDVSVGAEGFSPWRGTPHHEGGLWVLERSGGQLARLHGHPMARTEGLDYAPGVFRPDPENCQPARLVTISIEPWGPRERPVALSSHPDGGLAILCWRRAGHSWLHRFDSRGHRIGVPLALPEARHAFDLDWVDEDCLVLRLPGLREAPAVRLSSAADQALPISGEIYPLPKEALEAPFARHLEGPPRIPIPFNASRPGQESGLVGLQRLSISNLARRGEATPSSDTRSHPIDSGAVDTVWHRLHAEARLPARTGMVVWLAATTERIPPANDQPEAWIPHYFGDVPAPKEPLAPQAVYDGLSSEIPFHQGLASWSRQRGVAGLWSVLIQNPRRRVRRLVGRYLWIRLELMGDGRVTPELAALRVWASRFSYRDRYLPRLYRETSFGAVAESSGPQIADLEITSAELNALDNGLAPGDALVERLRGAGVLLGEVARIHPLVQGRHWILCHSDGLRTWHLVVESADDPLRVRVSRAEATAADFLERFLCSFEGLLTSLEDRVASAHLLTDPRTIPEEHLGWLANWIGVGFDPALPPSRRRQWLVQAPEMARRHGTRAGLELALDVATNGGVSGGSIVVIEDFRLRRLLATLLGVDRADESDPLLAGLVVSGNSVVGDSLVLGEEETAELRSLYGEQVTTATDVVARRSFQGELAHRATVLVHRRMGPVELGLIRRIVELERPAHVVVSVKTASTPLMVGIASLVGVDTYLGPARQPRPVRLEESTLGEGTLLLTPAALDPRTVGGRPPPPPRRPVADAGDDLLVASGSSFRLDGSGSRVDAPRRIDHFIWRRLPPEG